MERVSDESILYAIEYYSKGECFDDIVVNALTELRERREQENTVYPCPVCGGGVPHGIIKKHICKTT